MSGYTAGRWDAMEKFAADRDLLLWLHAEAVWHRGRLDDEALKWTEVAGQHAEEIENLQFGLRIERDVADRMTVEIARLRREVEFEAKSDPNLHVNFGFAAKRPCACVTDKQAAVIEAGGLSRPQCAVHPDGDE